MKSKFKKFKRNSEIFETINSENFFSLNNYLKKKFLAILKNQKKIAEIYSTLNVNVLRFNNLEINIKQYRTVFYYLYEYLYNNFEFEGANFKLPHRFKKISYVFSQKKLSNFQSTDIENIYKVENLKNKQNFTVQNYSSAIPPSLLPIKNNSIIIDGCAAPGNKTNQLLHLIDETSKIFAVEISEFRYNFLKERFFAENKITTINSDFLNVNIKADYILLDVPCSGSGTDEYFTKDDIKLMLKNFTNQNYENYAIPEKNYTDDNILNYHELQVKLLRHAISLKPKYICYSTCSIFTKENIEVVNLCLSENTTVEKIVEVEKTEEKIGFFACLLKII